MSACNCKVNQHITYLHKKYGNEIPVSKKSHINFLVKQFFKNMLWYLLMIIIFPLIFLHIISISLFTKKKKINIGKILGLEKAYKTKTI